MFRGFATVNVFADDVVAARDWYAQAFGVDAYFAMPPAPAAPAYVEFRVGDDADEFGIIDRRWAPAGSRDATGPAGAIIHWHVDDLPGTVAHLIALGATEYQPITAHSQEFVTASVVDPFGNVLGVMHNPHFLEIAASRAVAIPA